MQRIYCPRHCTQSHPQTQWIVGWQQQQSLSAEPAQICIATTLARSDIAESALIHLMHTLASHPKLRLLWTHTGGAPQLLRHIALDSASNLPTLDGSSPASSTQLILFDAPAFCSSEHTSARFFSTRNPFDSDSHLLLEDRSENDSAGDASPLALSDASSASSSELEQVLRQINAVAAVDRLINHFVQHPLVAAASSTDSISHELRSASLSKSRKAQRLHNGSQDSNDSGNSFSDSPQLPPDFDFAAALSPPSRAQALAHTMLAPFSFLTALFVRLFFFVIRCVLLPMLELPVLSLSRLVSSLFAPGMHRRLRVQSVPMHQASHTLSVLHEKLTMVLRVRQLRSALHRHHASMLGVSTPASVRAHEDLWGGLSAHVIDARLGLLVGVGLLMLLGWFDHVQLPPPLDSWITLPNSQAMREAFFVPQWIVAVGAYLSESLESLLSSSAPAGLKLNHRLHAQLARLLRQGVADQSMLMHQIVIAVSSSALAMSLLQGAVAALAFLCITFGLSLLLGVLLDVVWICSLPLVLVHATLARVSSFTCSLFRSLLLLFRGQKRNVLRGGRLDSFPMSANYDHVLLGTLGLACTTFLAPTILLWHAMATTARVVGAEMPRATLWILRAGFACAPWQIVWMIARDRIDDLARGLLSRGAREGGHRIPGGVWMEVMPDVGTNTMMLHSAPAATGVIPFRLRVWMKTVLRAHPPKQLLAQLIWGNDRAQPAAMAAA